jgi:hypothetical protein
VSRQQSLQRFRKPSGSYLERQKYFGVAGCTIRQPEHRFVGLGDIDDLDGVAYAKRHPVEDVGDLAVNLVLIPGMIEFPAIQLEIGGILKDYCSFHCFTYVIKTVSANTNYSLLVSFHSCICCSRWMRS